MNHYYYLPEDSIPEGAFIFLMFSIGLIGIGYLLITSDYLILKLIGFIIAFLAGLLFIIGFPSMEKDEVLKLDKP